MPLLPNKQQFPVDNIYYKLFTTYWIFSEKIFFLYFFAPHRKIWILFLSSQYIISHFNNFSWKKIFIFLLIILFLILELVLLLVWLKFIHFRLDEKWSKDAFLFVGFNALRLLVVNHDKWNRSRRLELNKVHFIWSSSKWWTWKIDHNML